MDLNNIIYLLSDKVKKNKEHCKSEEATKTSLVIPFLTALGYDTTDPLEVMPEATRDYRTNRNGKGERVDYVIRGNGKDFMLVECKHWQENLDNHVEQLKSYYIASDAKVGLLTNGLEYRFYSETIKEGFMDVEPFFVFDIVNPTDNAIESLKMFQKSNFNYMTIVKQAENMITGTRLHDIVERELSSPSDELVSFFWNRLETGKKLSRQKRDIFAPMVREEIANYTMSRINRAVDNQMQLPPINNEDKECVSDLTEEEQSIVDNVYSILTELVPKDRLHLYRNWWKQITVRLDNDQFHTICKLNIGTKSKWVAVSRYWPPSRKFYIKDSFRLYFDTPDGINQYAQNIKDTMLLMLMDDNEKRKEWVELHHKYWLE